MSITTKKGDGGFTDLPDTATGIENNGRVQKDHPYIEYLGTLDELDASLALCEIALQSNSTAHFSSLIKKVREALFTADNHPDIAWLEQHIETLEKENPIHGFVKNWTNPAAAAINAARTVCRRCERRAITALTANSATVEISSPLNAACALLNRLSDLLFLLAVAEEKNFCK